LLVSGRAGLPDVPASLKDAAMPPSPPGAARSAAGGADRRLADVLVLGGGPAGTWAALSAAAAGARVVLADKGFCGASGATAAAGTAVWYVPPDPVQRQAAMQQRWAMGGWLADPAWMGRVLERAWDGVNQVAEWGTTSRRTRPVRSAATPCRGRNTCG
jgi:succinate dehydrogenase/fumarate reductase flavoprotein subunit